MPNLPRQTPRYRRTRLLAMTSAAAILVVGLGAFSLLPAVHQHNVTDTGPAAAATEPHAPTPRMLENASPFSFADLVERVGPAVVTITSETMTTESDSDEAGAPDNLPPHRRPLKPQLLPLPPSPPRLRPKLLTVLLS